MKKVIRLTESDLVRIVERVIKEQEETQTNQTFNIDTDMGWVGLKKNKDENTDYNFRVISQEQKENPNSSVDKKWIDVTVGLGDLLEFRVYVSPTSINVISFGHDWRKSTDNFINWKNENYTHICYNNNIRGTICFGRRNKQNVEHFEERIKTYIPKTNYFINLQKSLQN